MFFYFRNPHFSPVKNIHVFCTVYFNHLYVILCYVIICFKAVSCPSVLHVKCSQYRSKRFLFQEVMLQIFYWLSSKGDSVTSSSVRVLALGSGRPVGGEAEKSTAAQHCVSNKGGFLCQPWGSSANTHMHLWIATRRRWVKYLEQDQAPP